MGIESNKEAYQMVKNTLGSIENRFREAYNKGYKDGLRDGASQVTAKLVSKILEENEADTPQTEQTEPTCSQLATNLQPTEPSGYKMKPLEQTESRDLAQDLATGKESILSIAIKGKMERRGKQTDCPWK